VVFRKQVLMMSWMCVKVEEDLFCQTLLYIATSVAVMIFDEIDSGGEKQKLYLQKAVWVF